MSAFHPLDHVDLRAAVDVPGLVLLDFWQVSCAPCRALEPSLEQVARRRSGEFIGYRIDVDASPQAADDFDVQSIPTVILIRDGREVTRLDGLIRGHDVEQALDAQRPPIPPQVPRVTQPRHRAASGSVRQAEWGDADPPRPSARLAWVRLLALVAILVTAGVTAAVVGLPDAQQIRARSAEAGPAAPALFVLLYALVTLLPLPKNVFAALAGVLFGLLLGVVVVLLAALLGAAAAFALSRVLGRDAVERITGARVARVDALLSRRGIPAVIAVRLIPILPFTVINYAAGLTSIRTRDYAIGTAVGIVPGTVSFVALGAFGTTPGSWPFLISAAVLIMLTAGGLLVARTSRRRHGGSADQVGRHG